MPLQIGENGYQVMNVEEINTGTQIAIVATHYDFIYHTRLTYDPGTKKVKAEVYNYLNEFQATFTGPITFEYEGAQVTVDAQAGVAEIDFTAPPGEHLIKTANTTMRNGEVVINVD